MRIKTLLNHCYKYSYFIFGEERLVKEDGDRTFDTDSLVVELKPRANGLIVCSKCDRNAPKHDELSRRLFQHIVIWRVPVSFAYMVLCLCGNTFF